MARRRQESEEFWNGDTWQEEDEYRRLTGEYEAAWGRWHEKCMEWWEESEADLGEYGNIVSG